MNMEGNKRKAPESESCLRLSEILCESAEQDGSVDRYEVCRVLNARKRTKTDQTQSLETLRREQERQAEILELLSAKSLTTESKIKKMEERIGEIEQVQRKNPKTNEAAGEKGTSNEMQAIPPLVDPSDADDTLSTGLPNRQVCRPFDLKKSLQFTPDKNSYSWSFAVMRSTDQLVVCCFENFSTFVNIYTPDEKGKTMKLDRRIKLPCSHHLPARVLCLEAAGQEYLALHCGGCKDIKLLDVETGTSVVPVTGSICRMCNGDKNRLFVQSKWGTVTELDCLTLPFTEVKTIETGLEGLACFVPCPPRLVFLSWNQPRIQAASMDGNILWTVVYDVPIGNVTYVDGLGLLVSGCGELIVLHPEDGSHLQTIDLPGARLIRQLVPCGHKIIILHCWNKLSTFDVIIKKKKTT